MGVGAVYYVLWLHKFCLPRTEKGGFTLFQFGFGPHLLESRFFVFLVGFLFFAALVDHTVELELLIPTHRIDWGFAILFKILKMQFSSLPVYRWTLLLFDCTAADFELIVVAEWLFEILILLKIVLLRHMLPK